MRTMNYESSKWSRDAIDDVPVDEEELIRRRKRRRIIVAIVLILLVVVAAFMMMRGGGSAGDQKGPAAKAAMRNGQMPTVTFIIPARQEVPIMISATGSLAAGEHEARWDVTDASGKRPAAGVYFARLTATGRTVTRRFVLAS